jgi:hypothetical protein
MANKYWKGGNWSDTANWSDTLGGDGGASKPTSGDNVLWHSIPASNTYTIDETANCLDFDFTGATNSPTLAGNQGLNIYGSPNFAGIGNRTYTGTITFQATAPGKTITTGGLLLGSNINFYGIGGGWTLQDDFVTSSQIYVRNGTLNTNGKAVNCSAFNSSGTAARSLIFGASTITCTSNWTYTDPTNLTFDAGTSTIIMTGNSRTFAGGGLTYNNVRFSGTPITVTGANTFNTLTVDSGKTCTLPASTTQTASALSWNGATIQSSAAGTAATVSVASGTVTMNWGSLKDITAEGGATFNGVNVTNVSGNDGWNWSITKNKIPMSMGMGM